MYKLCLNVFKNISLAIYIIVPLYGDLNFTPSSVISANCNNETIWKPPESVNKALFQFINLCKPPALRRISAPYQYI